MKKILIILCFISSIAKAADTTFVLKRLSPVPISADKAASIKLNLSGNWYFNPSPEASFENNPEINASWKKIEVPGEWVMQGFKVDKNKWAGYTRNFIVPQNWVNKRIKLRCDGVYSESIMYINGKKVGYHLGGFTPFEFDITNLVKPGLPAIISIKVKNEGLADSLASGSQYAVHSLGGITRKIYLMAVPDVNISMFHASAIFDAQYKNAVLKTELQLANETDKSVKDAAVLFELFSPETQALVFSKRIKLDDIIKRNGSFNKVFEFPVQQPQKWDPEHPRLYTYRVTLQANGASEVVERKIGFRQIEVRGNRVFVNNMPLKLRGACRHEVMPLRGRSLTGDQWLQDVKLFREENVNYIRTSHYPPAEEFVQACDSLGMFLEVEAPFCWADGTNVPDSLYNSAILDQTLDMVNFYRSSPSVLDWSLANESQGAYKRYFKTSGELVKRFDPTRPRIYNQYGNEGDDNELEIGNEHYPGPNGPFQYRDSQRPVMFGEYTHLNAYNRLELVTDPGIRDAWGIGFKNMWEKMYATPAILGGCIWAGIDDTFILPDGKVVGYGTWGPIDGWRRTKPEYWHVKKTYSPVIIQLTGNYKNGSVKLTIENRFLFSNINECKINWRAGKHAGSISPYIETGKKQDVGLKLPGQLSAKDTLFINVLDARNVLVDQYAFAIIPQVTETIAQHPVSTPIKYNKNENEIEAMWAGIKITLNKDAGDITVKKASADKTLMQLGELMILPLNSEGRGTQMTGENQVFDPFTSTCSNHIIKSVTYTCLPQKFIITINDSYNEAWGRIIYEFNADRSVGIHYKYTLNKDINPSQWGLVVSLANDFNTISWKRKGLWNYYPADHIGRLAGTANELSAASISGPAGPVQKPAWTWANDRNEMGTNDFRSTKMNITYGAIKSANTALSISSDGAQHLRVWKENDQKKMLVAGYSNLGSEGFFRGHAQLFDKPLKQGDVIEDTVNLKIE